MCSCQNFTHRNSTLYGLHGPRHGQTLASHNLPTNRARELIKPSTDSASLRLEIVKKDFRIGFWVLCVLRHNESIFGLF